MEYYALLTVATTIIAILALALYRKSGDLGVLVGTAALYYWSLFGAWYIVLDKSGGYSGKFYHYLEYKMFDANLDSNYMARACLLRGFRNSGAARSCHWRCLTARRESARFLNSLYAARARSW